MEILYATYYELEKKDGITKKMTSQINSLKKLSENVLFIASIEKDVYIFESGFKKKLFNKKSIYFVNNYIAQKKISDIFLNRDIKLLYLRHNIASKATIKLLKQAKKHGVKCLVEIPTYPYDNELKSGWKNKLLMKIDVKNRKKYKKYVDYIVTFSNDEEIWGIPCINISNGIDLDTTKLIEKVENDILTFSSVSICAEWHGIDRFLIAIEDYMTKNHSTKIKFNIVGEGSETAKLKKIVDKSDNLKSVVIFHGFKSGEELDVIYNETDIAVGSLGRHRNGLASLKTLKNREYAAKGIPMLYSEIDCDFEKQDFVYKVTPDEGLIDLEDVIKWYQALEIHPKEIREYAMQFSWDIQMQNILDKLGEEFHSCQK